MVTFTFLSLISVTLPVRSKTTNSCIEGAKKTSDPLPQIIALGRAKNVARQAAQVVNSGIEKYRPEDVMHGPVTKAPCTDNGDGTWTFNFQGMVPGGSVPIRNTTVTIDSKTFDVKIDRNTVLK
ncbi:MAG: hypothetical protein HRU34_12615 [Richelia sp.]|nr:hypothetical protein [Richelia sp.]